MSDHIDAVRSALLASVSLGDDQTRTLAEAIAHTSEPGLRQVTLSLYNQLAGDLSSQLPDAEVVVQMVDGEPKLVAEPKSSGFTPSAQAEMDDDPVRTTVRLPTYLKNDVEAAAKSAGISINTWIVDAIRSALHRSKLGTPPQNPSPFSSGSMSGWYS
ncbi:hypothetical protein BSZ39_09210 [Bowdeniella nasicola]|uniref:HicB family protein n=2 Tax=Bowdeniella nasicola TaxID=208480 RepID=A0A1Q5Q144_9ACTO|nr:hypothetical protein BSZ39_09210 [Bowdeniella nasicola]